MKAIQTSTITRLVWPGSLFLLLIVLTAIPADAAGESMATTEMVAQPDTGLYIGPIPGLTTAWHLAPETIVVPRGITLQFRAEVPDGAAVEWRGAEEVAHADGWSEAHCHLSTPGEHIVELSYRRPDGRLVRNHRRLEVGRWTLDDIRITRVEMAVDPVEVDPADVVGSTYRHFRSPSVAGLRKVSENHWRTSVRRRVHLRVGISPVELAPLMEWRTVGNDLQTATTLGAEPQVVFDRPGKHAIWVGPPGRARRVYLETYGVEITSHTSSVDLVPDGKPVTFRAVTEPPGYEEEITWLAATSFGQSDVVTGQGASFTVTFVGSVGSHPLSHEPFQWLGVRADNAIFNQDQKGVQVHGITPNTGSEGTEVRISGIGFPVDPLDTCVSIGDGAAGIRLVSGSPTELLGFVRGGSSEFPGSVTLVTGSGGQIPDRVFEFPEGSITVDSITTFAGDDIIFTDILFHPVPSSGTFDATQGTNSLCYILTQPWQAGDQIEVDIHLMVEENGSVSFEDMRFNFTIPLGGPPLSAEDCAERIAQMITQLFENELGTVSVLAIAEGNKITVTHSSPVVGGYGFIKRTAGSGVPENPDLNTWNILASCKGWNNCYNYATNRKTGTFAQPGRASGMPIDTSDGRVDCPEAIASAVSDGLIPVGDPNGCGPGQWPVTLVLDPLDTSIGDGSWDYHWYRRNADGTWSHKAGGTCATNLDASGMVITDPTTADRGRYTEVCGFFCVPTSGLTVNLQSQPQALVAADTVSARVLAFSGQENPGWEFAFGEIEDLRSRLTQGALLPKPDWDGAFGFTGFSLEPGTEVTDFPDLVRVWQGVVAVTEGIVTQYYEDTEGLEQLLTTRAIAEGFGDLIPGGGPF